MITSLMQFTKYGKINPLSIRIFTGMSPLTALFIDKSFTRPLTKSSFTGLNGNLFEVVIFFQYFHSHNKGSNKRNSLNKGPFS